MQAALPRFRLTQSVEASSIEHFTMAITFTGLASGLDTNAIMTDLVRFSQKRIDVLKAREKVETSRQTAFKNIETRLQTLQTQAARLGRVQGNVFDRKSVSTSDSTLVAAAAGSSAQAGVTSLRVLSLAQNHQVASQGFDDPNSLVTQGTSTQVGDLEISSYSFRPGWPDAAIL